MGVDAILTWEGSNYLWSQKSLRGNYYGGYSDVLYAMFELYWDKKKPSPLNCENYQKRLDEFKKNPERPKIPEKIMKKIPGMTNVHLKDNPAKKNLMELVAKQYDMDPKDLFFVNMQETSETRISKEFLDEMENFYDFAMELKKIGKTPRIFIDR